MKMTLDDIQGRESRHVLQTYRRQPVAFVRGSGPRLYDVDGREYLDFVSGIGVASLGHAHPGLARAIAEQASTLLHTVLADVDGMDAVGQCQLLEHDGNLAAVGSGPGPEVDHRRLLGDMAS